MVGNKILFQGGQNTMKEVTGNELWLSIPNAARVSGLSEHTLRKWVDENSIQFIRVGVKALIYMPGLSFNQLGGVGGRTGGESVG